MFEAPKYKVFYRETVSELSELAAITGKECFTLEEVKAGIEEFLETGGCLNDLEIYELKQIDEAHIAVEINFL